MSSINFCRKCNNILYPKQDIQHKILHYSCSFCDHQETADDTCIYRSDIHHSAGEPTQSLQDVAANPTHPRTKSVRCARCNHGETAFYQATCKGEEGKALFFECCSPICGHKWRA